MSNQRQESAFPVVLDAWAIYLELLHLSNWTLYNAMWSPKAESCVSPSKYLVSQKQTIAQQGWAATTCFRSRNFEPLIFVSATHQKVCPAHKVTGRQRTAETGCEVEWKRNLVAHGDAREEKWRGNMRMEWVASNLALYRKTVYPALPPLMRTHRQPAADWTDTPTDLNGLVRFAERPNLVSALVPSRFERAILQSFSADPHSKKASTRLNWHPRRYKWTRPFRWKTESGFCACAITFRLHSTAVLVSSFLYFANPEICKIIYRTHHTSRD